AAAALAASARRAAIDPSLLGAWHAGLTSRAARHARGQYYTPAAVVELVLDSAGHPGSSDLLDPMCGAGAFLVAALRRLAAAHPGMGTADLAARVQGMDVDPLTVLLARAACLLTLAHLCGGRLDPATRVQVACMDAVRDEPASGRAFGIVAGNPPWVAWDHLPEAWRRDTYPLWRRHGLFAEDGSRKDMQAVLGSGRKDLAMLATCVAADRWLAPGGTLSFVLGRGLLKSVGSASGFRRFVTAGGVPLRVVEVHDLGSGIFRGTAARPIVLTLRKGEPTRYPVPWRRGAACLQAEPVDPADPCSAWMTLPAVRHAAVRGVLGPSPYQAHAGAYTGGANGVYWVRRIETAPDADGTVEVANLADAGRRPVPAVTVRLEAGLLYPLARAGDVGRFSVAPSAWILLAQDPARRQGIDDVTMRARFPRALAYLTSMAGPLEARRDRGTRALIRCGAPPWTMFGVSMATVSSWKVVWPRIASRMSAAVLGPRDGRPVVPQETCSLIACEDEEEASYLAGMLNGPLFQEAAAAFADTGGKSFGSPHLLRHIAVPRFERGRPDHRRLARAVMQQGPGLTGAELNELTGAVWGVSSPPAAIR
ncbi:MAG: N-6 DNA methylase, partial [Candidatus Polarisedimenticolia bacterium]